MEIIESKIEEADRLKSDISTKEIKCNQISQNVIKIQENIDCLGNSNVLLLSNQKDLEKIEKEINDLEEERKILFEEKKYIDTAISLLKDGGIKSRIIKQYLPVINKMINKYLSQMNFFVNFTLDENFDETIKSRYRDDFAYQNFSEGEKTRIDLALLLTWRAIAKLKNSASTNLLIFDEIFDSSLDESGTDEFLKIMWSLVGDTNVFVISHKDQMFDKFKKVYRFKKKKNFSVIS
jgi:DNA repair exonuclease SbcCD ATPase subunit